jgi:hypothetical protein
MESTLKMLDFKIMIEKMFNIYQAPRASRFSRNSKSRIISISKTGAEEVSQNDVTSILHK